MSYGNACVSEEPDTAYGSFLLATPFSVWWSARVSIRNNCRAGLWPTRHWTICCICMIKKDTQLRMEQLAIHL